MISRPAGEFRNTLKWGKSPEHHSASAGPVFKILLRIFSDLIDRAIKFIQKTLGNQCSTLKPIAKALTGVAP
jgi:hypothetical protein